MKKKQKMKGKTLNLNEFLADESGTSGPGSSYVLAAKPMSWGEQMESQEMEGTRWGGGTTVESLI